jgi:hypothetical protein
MNELPETSTVGLPPCLPSVRGDGCSEPDCDEKHFCRGLCRRHWRAAYYRANAARSLALNQRWRAQNRPQPEVSRDLVDCTDVSEAGGVARVASVAPVARNGSSAPAGRRATPVAKKAATTAKGSK